MTKQEDQARKAQEVAMDVYPFRCTAWHARKARRIGGGNMSEGIRKAIFQFNEEIEKAKSPKN